MMMKFNVTANIYSEVLECTYMVGRTEDGQYVYFWTNQEYEEGIIPSDALESPECMHGALVGALDVILDDIENCVGLYRDAEVFGSEMAEAAHEVVETLKGGLGA